MNRIVQQQYAGLQQALEAIRDTLPQLEQCVEVIAGAVLSGHKILAAGNGGSAADALHLCEELIGRYKGDRRSLPAVALTADATALTCIANDYGFEHIFSRQVEGLGQAGDVLVLFTTSGNSPNLLSAAEAARKRGVKVVAFSGREGGKLKGQPDAEWIVPAKEGSHVQELHGWALHVVLEVVEERLRS